MSSYKLPIVIVVVSLIALIAVAFSIDMESAVYAQELEPNGVLSAQTDVIPADVSMVELIEQAEMAWREHEIANYVLEFNYTSVWSRYNVSVVVAGNLVNSMRVVCGESLIPTGACSVPRWQPNDLTVLSLFERIKTILDSSDNEDILRFDLSAEYDFPTDIYVDDPEILDEEWSVQVTRFEVFDPEASIPNVQSIVATSISIPPTPNPCPEPVILTVAPSTIVDLTPEEVPFDDNLMAWIDDAESDWEAQGISDYEMTIRLGGAWTSMTATMIVHDNRVAEIMATCESGAASGGFPCWLAGFTFDEFTLAGLFERARIVAEMPMPMFNPLSFDATYGFPLGITFDDLQMADEEWFLRVLRFVIL